MFGSLFGGGITIQELHDLDASLDTCRCIDHFLNNHPEGVVVELLHKYGQVTRIQQLHSLLQYFQPLFEAVAFAHQVYYLGYDGHVLLFSLFLFLLHYLVKFR